MNLWSAWRTYRGLPLLVQGRALGRLLVVPISALRDELAGTYDPVLSVGAGDGAIERYLVRCTPVGTIDCSDIDPARVAHAQASGDTSGLRFVVADATEVVAARDDGYSVVLAIDLLHHLPREEQATVLSRMVAAARPGGRVIVKDIGTTPRWKHAFNRWHDRIMSGDDVTCIDPEAVADHLRSCGAQVTVLRRFRYSPYPHYLVSATVTGGASR